MYNASKMNVYITDFDETKYMSFFFFFTNCYEKITEFGTESARLLKIDLIVSLYTMINISKLK